jgi:OOP family OmpA-OmpF porin
LYDRLLRTTLNRKSFAIDSQMIIFSLNFNHIPMSSKNTLWWLLLAIWSVGAVWWHTCKIKLLCDEPITSVISIPSVTTNKSNLLIRDGTELSLSAPGNFKFGKSGDLPVMDGIHTEIDSLLAYLGSNPDKRSTITGHYASTETNTTKWPNLGIARAENVKAYMVSKGFTPERLITKGLLDDRIVFAQDTLTGGIDFDFALVGRVDLDEKTVVDIFKPMDLYFNTGSDLFIRNAANSQFIKDAKTYLEAHKDKQLLLTGHTDNTGKEDLNLILSKKRAENVKRELVKAGLASDQLILDAKGQSEPKASNNTLKGREENRRVSIMVK